MSEIAKGNCIQFEDSRSAKLYSNPRVSEFGTTDNGCDLWMFGFHFLTNSVGSFPPHMSCISIYRKPIFFSTLRFS